MQAEIWKWLQEKHPDKRVITNESPGTLSQLFADGILLENPYGSHKTELDYEAAKALGTTIIAYEYPETIWFKGLPVSEYRYLVLRYRATGINKESSDYIIAIYPGGKNTAMAHRDLQADGEWHTAIVDLKTQLPKLTEVGGLGVQVLASGNGEARLEVEYIRLTPDPDGGEGPTVPADTLPTPLDTRQADLWLKRQSWLRPAIRAGIRSAGEGIEFFVDDPNRSMAWATAPRLTIAREYMRALSYGGCIGGRGQLEWFLEINDFLAEAMAMPLLVGSHDVEVLSTGPREDESTVTASAWAGHGKLLLGAYNGGQAGTTTSITVAAKALQSAGISRVHQSEDCVLSRAGRRVSDRRAKISFSAADGLRVSVGLRAGEALLCKMLSET